VPIKVVLAEDSYLVREGVRAAERLRQLRPTAGVVLLSQYADPAYALAFLESGTEGRAYLLKERVADLDQLLAAIREVAGGGSVIDSKAGRRPGSGRRSCSGPSSGRRRPYYEGSSCRRPSERRLSSAASWSRVTKPKADDASAARRCGLTTERYTSVTQPPWKT
jgi:hypothetical protein